MAKSDAYKDEPQTEVEILTDGIKANSVSKGSYYQNVWKRKNAWEVRAGFGQVAQYDGTLGYNDGSTPYGFSKILGSQIFHTDFGHTQIVTLLMGTSFTGNTRSAEGYDRGQWSTYYTLSVFDVTTQDRWEELLTRHTSESNNAAMPMSMMHGAYETTVEPEYDFKAVVRAEEGRAYFCEFQDTMLFGTPKLGLWCYVPAMFMATRSMQFDALRTRNAPLGYSESPRAFPITPKDGQFSVGVAYLQLGAAPTPVDVCAWNNRVVYAAGRTLYFSDQGNPHSIQGLAVQGLQLQNDITAIAEVFDNLYVFTDSETCVFRPDTQTASGNPCGPGASFRRISEVVGCIGPQAHCATTDGLLWASRVGIHTSTGQYDLNTISGDIQPLFDEQLANPLQNFFTTAATGFVASDVSKLIMEYDWSDVSDVSVAYNDLWKMAIVTVPALKIALVRQDSTGWYVWNFETMVNQYGVESFTVGVTSNMMVDAILTMHGDVYAVGGIETFTPDDHTIAGGDGAAVNENAPSGSYFITQLGRGGGLDRSVEESDDRREFAGWYEQLSLGATVGAAIWIDKGVPVPQGYVLPQGAMVGSDPTWLVPIVFSAADGTVFQVDHLEFDVKFDNTHWQPIYAPGQTVLTSRIDAVLSPERGASAECFGLTAITMVPGTAEVQVYQGGVADQNGNTIRIRWTGTSSVAPYTSKPYMNVRPYNPAVLLWIPMQRVDNQPVQSMGWDTGLARQFNGVNSMFLYVYAYHERDNKGKHTADDVAQAIDWTIKSDQIGLDAQAQVMARSLFTRFLTHGKGVSSIVPAWPFGLFNTVLSSDWKDWASQIVDFGTYENTQQTKTPLRNRMLDSSANMAPRTFDNTARWSSTATPSTGNFLVDDEQVDVISISDGVRGENVSWMMFGHIMNRAERLAVQSATAVLRVLGGRRRIGR